MKSSNLRHPCVRSGVMASDSHSFSAYGGRLQNGFSLLEAIVAMVLIGTAGTALFALINQSLDSLYRIEQANRRAELAVDVLEFMDRINPMERPEGSVAIGRHQLSWRAKALTPVSDGAGYPQGISLYQFVLYETSVVVRAGVDGAAETELKLRQVGYKKARSAAATDF